MLPPTPACPPPLAPPLPAGPQVGSLAGFSAVVDRLGQFSEAMGPGLLGAVAGSSSDSRASELAVAAEGSVSSSSSSSNGLTSSLAPEPTLAGLDLVTISDDDGDGDDDYNGARAEAGLGFGIEPSSLGSITLEHVPPPGGGGGAPAAGGARLGLVMELSGVTVRTPNHASVLVEGLDIKVSCGSGCSSSSTLAAWVGWASRWAGAVAVAVATPLQLGWAGHQGEQLQ